MSRPKIRPFNCQCFYSVIFLSWIFSPLAAYAETKGAEPNLSVSLSCFKEQVIPPDPNQERPVLVPTKEANSIDPFVLKLTISNFSKQEISVLSPEFPAQTLLILLQRTSDEKLISPQVKWTSILIRDYINILPGATYEVLLYLEELYPLGIPPGRYALRLKYTPDYKTWVQTNAVFLEIYPMSEEDTKEYEEVITILEGGIEYKAEAAKRFLVKFPESRFANILRLASFDSLMVSKKLESANEILDKIIDDKKSTTYQKNQAYWQKAHLLKNIGKLEESIRCMEKAKFRGAYREAKKWRYENEFLRKSAR